MVPTTSGTNRTVFILAVIGWILGIVGAGLWHWHRVYMVCLIVFSTLVFLYVAMTYFLDQMRSSRNVQLLAATLACMWTVGLAVAAICKSIDASDICSATWVGEGYCTQAVISVVCTWCSCVAWLLSSVNATKNVRGL